MWSFRTLRWALFLLSGYTFFCLVAGILLAEGTLHPGRRVLPDGAEAQARLRAEQLNADFENVAIQARDGTVLRAWSFRPIWDEDRPHDAVLLLHGVSDNRLGMAGYAEILLKHGYSVVMPDARDHGASGGDLATYGLLEKDDIRRWFDWIKDRQRPHCIFGFGESMGAAQVLEALQTEPHFCAVAAESSFSTLREIGYDRVGQFFHRGPWLGRTVFRPVIEIAFQYARWKYRLDLRQGSPEDAVAATKVPVLLIDGQTDNNIPLRHSQRIRARNARVVLWEVAGANHCGAISVARGDLEARLVSWFH